jgi:sucrose-6-phosphate hydrolase SacC (GH32 family)
MRRVRWLVVFALLFIPGASHAFQLHWSSGADTLTFTEATRAVLVLRADSAEVTLPPEWRLLWVGDSTEVQVVALDSAVVCEGDTAQVYDLDGPSTPDDSTAHRVTAHFCSGGSSEAEQATFVLDLPAWGRGKCKVVALDPADSTVVLESNEVTFNGGVSDAFEPVLLGASSLHQSTRFTIRAVGSGLEAIRSASLAAQDGRWRVSLEISDQDGSTLTASADIVADVPASILQGDAQSSMATIRLPADATFSPQNVQWAPSYMQEAFTQVEWDSLRTTPPHGRIQPKDFAFIYARGRFHLFYIRLNMWDSIYVADKSSARTEKNLGHARSTDLIHWWDEAVLPRDTTVLQVRSGHWDNFHVWAPSIVQQDTTYFMFYTGVTDTILSDQTHRYHQRIGVATSSDLDTWTRYDAPVLRADDVLWAHKAPLSPYDGSQQLRDAYVMEDPEHPGHWLMHFVAVDSTNNMAVGVAKSTGNLFRWTAEAKPLRSTASPRTHASKVESPHVFSHGNQWWMFLTPGAPLGQSDSLPYNPVAFETNMDSLGGPADTTLTHWSTLDTLYNYIYPNPDDKLAYWHGSEYLAVDGHEYLAAYDDWHMDVAISEIIWTGDAEFTLGSASVADVGVGPDRHAARGDLRLALSGTQPARSRVSLQLELPSRMHVRLAVFDVGGRRVKTLLDGELPAGLRGVVWDGHDASGASVGCGVYFARLTCPQGTRVVKSVLLR